MGRTSIGSVVAVAVVLSGCAAYGWADRPSDEIQSARVAVSTVDVSARHDVDSGALTRVLVDELRGRGVSSATWSGASVGDDARRVACRVDFHDATVFGDRFDVRAVASCEVSGAVVRRRATAQGAFGEDVVGGRAKIRQIVAERSVASAAGPVARRLATER